MSPMASQITSFTIVYSTVYSGADQRKHQSSTSLPLWGEFTDDQWIPPQRASDAENVSIWWRHHVMIHLDSFCLMIPLAGPSPWTMPSVVQKMGLFLRNELKQFSAKINLFSNKKWAWKWCLQNIGHLSGPVRHTLYPLKHAHGLAVLCFVVVII